MTSTRPSQNAAPRPSRTPRPLSRAALDPYRRLRRSAVARDHALSRCAARSGPTSLGAAGAIAAAVRRASWGRFPARSAGPRGVSDGCRPEPPPEALAVGDSARAERWRAARCGPNPPQLGPPGATTATTFRPLPSPTRRLPLAGALADVNDAWRPQDERPASAGGLLSPPGPHPECVEARRPFAPISSSSPAPAGVAMKRARHGEDVDLATRLGGRARRSLRMRSWSHGCGA